MSFMKIVEKGLRPVSTTKLYFPARADIQAVLYDFWVRPKLQTGSGFFSNILNFLQHPHHISTPNFCDV